MPTVIINGPRFEDIDVKRALVREITDALEKAYKIQREAYSVVINENLPENVGVGGVLIIDRKKG